jgi:hypothetical protein
MSELEAVATRKEEAAEAGEKKARSGKVIGGVAVGAAVAAGLMKLIPRRQKVFDGILVPRSALPDQSTIPAAAAATAERMREIIAESLTPEEVAAALGIDTASVVKRIERRGLYAFRDEHGWRVPGFQFLGSRTVRHLAIIIPRLERDLHPIEVVNWFTFPHVDLVIGDASVSPLEWLERGGDGAVVASLADELGSGF